MGSESEILDIKLRVSSVLTSISIASDAGLIKPNSRAPSWQKEALHGLGIDENDFPSFPIRQIPPAYVFHDLNREKSHGFHSPFDYL